MMIIHAKAANETTTTYYHEIMTTMTNKECIQSHLDKWEKKKSDLISIIIIIDPPIQQQQQKRPQIVARLREIDKSAD